MHPLIPAELQLRHVESQDEQLAAVELGKKAGEHMHEFGLIPASSALGKQVRQSVSSPPEQVEHIELQGEQLLEDEFAKYPGEHMQELGLEPES